MPFKEFAVGEILTASDVNTYLAEQSIATFSSAGARNSAIPTPADGQVAYISSSKSFTYYDGTGWQQLLLPEWITYTPTINNVTLGSGYTLSAVYSQIGDMCIVNFHLTLGATTTITGDVNFSLPVNHASTNRSNASGNATIIDASPLTRYAGMCYPGGTPGYCYIRAMNASGTYLTQVPLSSSVPIAVWATGDSITASIVYQVA